ncbi:MAG: DNA helicase [Pseudoclavibacter caeni]|jgi:DNA helicase II / ATP-dependent DNA helicase PcrA
MPHAETATQPAGDLLAGLDAQQRRVAEALTGPVRVLAGAGTGKTRAITHRIAWGIREQIYQPHAVLALTFTSRAAAEMRLRLQRLGLPPVAARTFHAAALAQLRHFWPRVLGTRLPNLLTTKAPVIAEAATACGIDDLDTARLRDLSAQIEWRKVRSLTVEQWTLSEHAHVDGLQDDQIAAVMMRYERLKEQRHTIDFEDVLLAMTGMLRQEPTVADEVRDQYRFFVVDEYQDVSPVQHDLLREWMGRRRDLCVVGDPSQTIYSFSGADPRYLLDFDRELPGAVTIEMRHDYRSTRPIVDLANQVMAAQPGAVRLEADRPGPAPRLTVSPDEGVEAQRVAAAITRQIAEGASPAEIAVLMRVNGQTARYEQALADAGVPYQLRSAKPFFSRREVVDALLLVGVAAAASPASPAQPALERALAQVGWQPRPPQETSAQRERWESLDALRRLGLELGEGTSLAVLDRELRERREQRHPPRTETVLLSTIHAAKGLEWDHVHLVGLNDDYLPYGGVTDPTVVAEERRLLYVGVTRARQTLHLWAPLRMGGRRSQPSRLLPPVDGVVPGRGAAGRRPGGGRQGHPDRPWGSGRSGR